MSDASDPVNVPSAEVQLHEQHRWLIWFGSPALIAAIFTSIALGTGAGWWLAFAVIAIIADLFILIRLVFSTDTNGAIDGGAAHGH